MSEFKEDFEKWYHKKYTNVECFTTVKYDVFEELPIEMQFCVYKLFAVDNGFDIFLKHHNHYNHRVDCYGEINYTNNDKILCSYYLKGQKTLMTDLVNRLKEEYNNLKNK